MEILQGNSSAPALPTRIKRVFYMSSEGCNLLHEVNDLIIMCTILTYFYYATFSINHAEGVVRELWFLFNFFS